MDIRLMHVVMCGFVLLYSRSMHWMVGILEPTLGHKPTV